MVQKRATVRDIARHAGVSVATVSRVTRDDPRVTDETRARVQASIEALEYRPSPLGQSLAYGRYGIIGVVLPGLGGPYFAELIQGIDEICADQGVAINVLATHLRRDAMVAVRDLAERTDGILVFADGLDGGQLKALAERHRIVVVNGEPDGLARVHVDGRSATFALTTHLVADHGYTSLRFLGAAVDSPDISARYEGFTQALAAHGLQEAAPLLHYGLEQRYGALAARELVARGDLPRALVCANDELAMGVLAVLPGLGYRVPDDLAIVGFDDIPIAGLASPALTTVHQPIRRLGLEAATLLLAAVEGDATSLTDRLIELPTQLVIRQSCGCPAPSPSTTTTFQDRDD